MVEDYVREALTGGENRITEHLYTVQAKVETLRRYQEET